MDNPDKIIGTTIARRLDISVCQHGHQRRKCPHCEAEETEAELTARIAELELLVADGQALARRILQMYKDVPGLGLGYDLQSLLRAAKK